MVLLHSDDTWVEKSFFYIIWKALKHDDRDYTFQKMQSVNWVIPNSTLWTWC